MKTQILFAAALAVSGAAARTCSNITVPVTISARNAVFDLPPPNSDIDMINFFLNYARQGHNYTNEVLTGVCRPPAPPGTLSMALPI
jgi:hypothetical protein